MSFNQWQSLKVGDVADVLNGYAFKSKDFTDEGIPVIKIKNIVPPSIELSDVQYVSEELFNEKERFALKYNDILISMTGSNVNQIASAVGKVGRVRLKNKKLLLNQRVGKLYVTDSDKCNEDFLYYYLIQDEVRYNLALSASGSANQANINPNQIKNISINLPSIDEQKAIAKVLSDLDEKIEINNKINKKLEEMAQAIFKQWFVDFEFPNEDGKPYKSSGGEMVESELGMIPNGWEVIEFMDIMNISSGKRPTKKNNEKTSEFTIPLAGASSIMGYVKEYNYDEPILVIGRVGTHGVVQRFNGKVWASDNTLVITSTYHEFTYQILNRIDYSALNRGSTQPLITQTDIKKQKIVKAKCELLNEYEKITGDIFNTINNNNKEIDKLVLLRDTLLPKLMSGEIRVPVEN